MATWSIPGAGLQNLYQRLQEIASHVPDGEGLVPDGVLSPDSPDAYLSDDDILQWMKKRSAAKWKNLQFVEQQNGGIQIPHSSLADLSILYSYLLILDFTDGFFDGIIQNMPTIVDVPVDVDEMTMHASVYRKAVFEVKTTHRNMEKSDATAWVRDKERTKEGIWRYYLLTNAHVVDSLNGEKIAFHVRSASGKTYPAELIGADNSHDVGALTFVAEEDFPVLPIGLSLPSVGERVAEIGNQESLGIAYTPGTVNAAPDFSSLKSMPVIRYDSNSSRGNSGSPVFNSRGEVIGMDFGGEPNDMGASIGYAVPMSVAEESFQQLCAFGKHEDGGWLEATYRVLSSYELSSLGINEPVGYYIHHVDIGSRAERAGLRPGQILVAADGAELPGERQRFEYEISRKPAGWKMALDVVTIAKPNEKTTLTYTIDKRSAPYNPSWDTPFGFSVIDLNRETREELARANGIGDPGKVGGVLVRTPKPSSERSEEDSNPPFTGIPDAVVIEAVGDTAVTNIAEFREAVHQARASQNSPIAVRTISTAKSGPYAGFRSIYLINGIERRQQMNDDNLGIKYIDLDDTEKKALGIDPGLQSIYITQIDDLVIGLDQDPLFSGDVITGYNGQPLNGKQDDTGFPIFDPLLKAIGVNFPLHSSRTKTYGEYIESSTKGAKFSLQVLRNGQIVDVTRTVEGLAYPELLNGQKWTNSDTVLAYSLTAGQKKLLHFDEKNRGVYIMVRSQRNSPPHPYRLKSGMIVTSVNGSPVADPDQLIKALSDAIGQGRPVVLEVAGSTQWQFPGYRDFLVADPFN